MKKFIIDVANRKNLKNLFLIARKNAKQGKATLLDVYVAFWYVEEMAKNYESKNKETLRSDESW